MTERHPAPLEAKWRGGTSRVGFQGAAIIITVELCYSELNYKSNGKMTSLLPKSLGISILPSPHLDPATFVP